MPAPAGTEPADNGLKEVSTSCVAGETGAHFQDWNRVVALRNAKGNTVWQTNLAYVQLETGLHYWENERWNDSQELIEPYPGGAIARHGGHKVVFAENLNSDVVVDLQTPDGKRLQSRVLGLRFFDASSGKGVTIAEVKDCKGQIMGSNQVVYVDAFSGANADLRYTYTKAGLEQDIMLRTQLPTPEDLGFDSKPVRLQALTEFVTAPEPVIVAEKATARTLEDQTLDFGAMQIVKGRAFVLGEPGESTEETPVAKQWSVVEGRTILFEEVPLARISAQLQALPAKPRTASLRSQPARQMASQPGPKRVRKPASRALHSMRFAKVNLPRPGLVLDYVQLTTQPNVTLKGDTTYYVSGLANLSGATVIEAGTVVKYANASTAKIYCLGSVTNQAAPYRPAVFTSKDDNSVGETIVGSSGSPVKSTLNFYLHNDGGGSTSYRYLRMSYAGTGIRDDTMLDVWHSQFLNCTTALYKKEADVPLRNLLLVGCTTGVRTTEYIYAEHLTVDGCTRFAHTQVSGGTAVNSIFTGTTVGSVTVSSGSVNLPSSSGVYQTVGGGSHYLLDDTHRNKGTTAINSTLLADLRNRTTAGPTVLTANFTVDTPDRGYHYDPLDFCWSSLQLTGAKLTLQDGVAVGIYGTKGTWLRDGAQFISSGHATTLNRLVRYNTVQEGAWGTTATVMSLLNVTDTLPTLPIVEMNFTDISVLADWSSKRPLLDCSAEYAIDHLSLTDCQVRGASLDINYYPNGDYRVTSVNLKNNLLQRVSFSVDQDSDYPRLSVYLRNNLVLYGTFLINDYNGTGT